MENPDFIALANAYGIEAEKVDQHANLEKALERLFLYKGSYLLEVRVAQEENVFPMIPTGASVAEVQLHE